MALSRVLCPLGNFPRYVQSRKLETLPESFDRQQGEMKDFAKSILVVEDELFIRMAMADALRSAGFKVCEAADGEAASQIIASGDIAVLVTDIIMPGALDGLTLAKRVRAQSPQIKIVLISGNKYSDMASVADAVFFKPVRVSSMLDCVRELSS